MEPRLRWCSRWPPRVATLPFLPFQFHSYYKVIEFFSEDTDFVVSDQKKLTEWITTVVEAEGMAIAAISFIFCSDDYLLKINQEHLQHDYYTDIITFDYCEGKQTSGDLFISVDRVKENATELSLPFEDELHRVMVHGVLHLLGYKDKTAKHKAEMTAKENHYLALR